jgi:flavin reductase (DIM6/NTAB) family NADH-FMN oxidoreductase RutF
MAVGEDLFKQCLRRWASGVTIVTSRLGDEIHGMTVSAFSSVSAEPPLVLVCANKKSKTHAMISSSEIFNVHVLASGQQELGAPILEGALAVLECKLVSTYEEGSHTIYVGHVESAEVTDSEPLVYFQGGYRAISG